MATAVETLKVTRTTTLMDDRRRRLMFLAGWKIKTIVQGIITWEQEIEQDNG